MTNVAEMNTFSRQNFVHGQSICLHVNLMGYLKNVHVQFYIPYT